MKPAPYTPPTFSILKRLGQLADGFDVDWSRIPGPVAASAGSAGSSPGREPDRSAGVAAVVLAGTGEALP